MNDAVPAQAEKATTSPVADLNAKTARRQKLLLGTIGAVILAGGSWFILGGDDGVNEAFRSSTLVNLAALCVRLGRKLNFKSDASGFIGDDQANHLHSPALRGNWSI